MADLLRAQYGIGRSLPAPALLREFLSFRLGPDLYAVELSHIREIVSSPPLTEVPRAPSDVLGLCSVRGLLVTVFDLRRKLALPEEPPTRLSRILLANTESGEVIGVFVDEVRQVIRLAPSEIEVTANVLGGDLSDHVMGVGRPEGEFVILLEFARMLGG
jgi:purine-binding chemotaxis protein CheW